MGILNSKQLRHNFSPIFTSMHNKIYTSTASLKRFLNVGLALGDPVDFCHQTLTFRDAKESIAKVKIPLNRLLDSLHKKFQMVSLYAIEWGKEERLHVHILFLFYESRPSNSVHWLKKFSRVVFKRWNEINGGGLVKKANLTTRPPKGIDATYFIKEIRTLSRGLKKDRAPANWWGVRNKKMLNQHHGPVDQGKLKEIMSHLKAPKTAKAVSSNRENPIKWKPDCLLEDPDSCNAPPRAQSGRNQSTEVHSLKDLKTRGEQISLFVLTFT